MTFPALTLGARDDCKGRVLSAQRGASGFTLCSCFTKDASTRTEISGWGQGGVECLPLQADGPALRGQRKLHLGDSDHLLRVPAPGSNKPTCLPSSCVSIIY